MTYTKNEIEELLNGISPEPWRRIGSEKYRWIDSGHGTTCFTYVKGFHDDTPLEQDSKLIAAAPELARQLLDVMEENETLKQRELSPKIQWQLEAEAMKLKLDTAKRILKMFVDEKAYEALALLTGEGE